MKVLRFSLLFVTLLMPLNAAWGQSNVCEIPTCMSDTTIVRYWQDNISIVYTCRGEAGNKYFMLVDEMSPTVRRIAVPDHISVNDFRIFHDTVFFGGHYFHMDGVKNGLLACFAIQDFYNGSGTCNWMYMTLSQMPDCYVGDYTNPAFNHVCDVMRLAVYEDIEMGTKIAYIAKNYIVGETTLRVGIGEAEYFGGTSWYSRIIYNKYAIEEYTDIITTQNYVVALARTNDSARLAMRIFPKSSFIAMAPNPYWPLLWYYYNDKIGQGLADLEVDENVMATALGGDEFAVAYHYTNSPKEGLAVKTFNISSIGRATLLQGLIMPAVRQPGSTWKMRDVGYVPSLQRLVVLNDFDGGTVGSLASIIYQFSLPSLVSGTYYGRYLVGYSLHAMDSYLGVSDGIVASGCVAGAGVLSHYVEGLTFPASCGLQDAINSSQTTTTLYETFMQTNINEPVPKTGSYSYVVEVVERTVICSL